jgi:hypothetical protein
MNTGPLVQSLELLSMLITDFPRPAQCKVENEQLLYSYFMIRQIFHARRASQAIPH